jgi:hypothetical protein
MSSGRYFQREVSAFLFFLSHNDCVSGQISSVFRGWALTPYWHEVHLAAGPSTLKFIRCTRADDGDGALHTKYGLVSSNKCEPDSKR